MASTNQDILNKIGSIIIDISESYQSLLEDASTDKTRLMHILNAQSKNLSIELELLQNLSFEKDVVSNPPVNSIPKEQENPDEKDSDSSAHEEDKSFSVVDKEEIGIEEPEQVQEHKENSTLQFELEDDESEELTEVKVEPIELSEKESNSEEIRENVDATSQEEKFEQLPSSEKPTEAAGEVEELPTEASSEKTDIPVEKDEAPNQVKEQESTSTPEPNVEQEHTHKTESEPSQANEPVVKEVVIEQKEVFIETNPAASEPIKPARPLTLNELIQQQKQAGATSFNRNVSDTSNVERVKDMKSAISLNDKLLFIKDLFNGYSLAYSEAIELLNRFDSLSEADAFLQSNYSMKNGWSQKAQTVEKLYAILRKRFV